MEKLLVVRGSADDSLDATPLLALRVDVDMCEEILEKIAKVVVLTSENPSVYVLTYWDYRGDWFDLYSLDDDSTWEVEGKIDLEGYMLLDLDSELAKHILDKCGTSQYDGGAFINTDCSTLDVTDCGVHFTASVKHTGLEISGSRLSTDFWGKLQKME